MFALTATIAQGTVCSFTIPFKVGVHMDDAECKGADPVSKFQTYENVSGAHQRRRSWLCRLLSLAIILLDQDMMVGGPR